MNTCSSTVLLLYQQSGLVPPTPLKGPRREMVLFCITIETETKKQASIEQRMELLSHICSQEKGDKAQTETMNQGS